jgi:hypothetical protein
VQQRVGADRADQLLPLDGIQQVRLVPRVPVAAPRRGPRDGVNVDVESRQRFDHVPADEPARAGHQDLRHRLLPALKSG